MIETLGELQCESERKRAVSPPTFHVMNFTRTHLSPCRVFSTLQTTLKAFVLKFCTGRALRTAGISTDPLITIRFPQLITLLSIQSRENLGAYLEDIRNLLRASALLAGTSPLFIYPFADPHRGYLSYHYLSYLFIRLLRVSS